MDVGLIVGVVLGVMLILILIIAGCRCLKSGKATQANTTDSGLDDGLFQSFKNCIICNNKDTKKTTKAHYVKNVSSEPTFTIAIEKNTEETNTGHTNAALNYDTEDNKTDNLRIPEVESPIRRSANAYSEVDLNDELDDTNFHFSEFENKMITKM